MKCYSLIFLISLAAWGQTIELYTDDSSLVTYGDLVDFEVRSELSYSELKEYEGKRLDPRYRVLQVEAKNDKTYFKTIISPLQKGEKIDAKGEFEFQGVNFQHSEIDLNSPMAIVDYDIKLPRDPIWYFVALAGLLVIGFIVGKVVKRARARSKLADRRKQLDLTEEGLTREKLERVGKNRKIIIDLYEYDQAKLDLYLKHLDDYQYRSTIDDQNLQRLQNLYVDFAKTLKVKNGV